MTIYGSSDKKRLKYELRIFRPRNSKQLVLDVMCNDEVILSKNVMFLLKIW